ncbi:AzlC family ABC transporter permease [Saccharopolyspora sp. CA-218241]|uniref:AzlC family ABC transporter permease n=1 Tax=Saccharopolyspora sp. CA-218241 TaxID=3240027 RepID=UPI003D97EB9A
MSTVQRTRWWHDRLVRDALSMAAAMAIVGASLGAIAVGKGVPLWLITLMGAVVFAGGSEFMVVGLVTAGAAPVTAVLGGLMLNARHFPFGLAVGGLLDRGWPSRLLGSHLMVDESVAFALAQPTEPERKRAYWLVGIALYLAWAPSVFVGGLLGARIGDPAVLGLDAALPAALLALITPALREHRTLRAVALGALVAVATTPLLPEGLPVVAGLVGLAAALPLPKGVAAR